MNASKEKARQAIKALDAIVERAPSVPLRTLDDYRLLREFLVATERKLPSEAAYQREKCRK